MPGESRLTSDVEREVRSMSDVLREEFRALRPPSGGFRVVLADPNWRFENFSEKGEAKNPNQHYACADIDWIRALPVAELAADDCALFMWATWPMMPLWDSVITAWGFEYKSLAWEWLKFNPETGKYAFGPGYGTRKNLEPCLLATRGSPSLRKPLEFFGVTDERASSHSVRDFIQCMPLDAVRQPRGHHSQKPFEQYERIEQLFDGPYIELFAVDRRRGWASWGQPHRAIEDAGAAR
jgi:N6-adenosine-specific RNA methylase IME4